MGISFRGSLKIISLVLECSNILMGKFMKVSLRMGIDMGLGVIEIFMDRWFVKGIGIMITLFSHLVNDMCLDVDFLLQFFIYRLLLI